MPLSDPYDMGLKHFNPTAGLVSDFVGFPRNLVSVPGSYGLVAYEGTRRG